MTQIPNELTKNFKDPAVRRKLMQEYADCRGFQGKNEDDEVVWVDITSTQIIVTTYQKNGWIRVNYYDENGLPSGETYSGKWNKPEEKDEVVYLVVENLYEEGIVHVTPYKKYEAAKRYYDLLKSKHDENEIEENEDTDSFHVFGYCTCEIREKVMRDA